MARLDSEIVQEFALVGARARLAQLEAERAEILRAFPGLRSGRRGRPVGAAQGASTPTPAKAGRKRRRRMSPEARKRISDMMKKRWAERKGKGR